MKFYIYQCRDNPNCGYGTTGEISFGGEIGFDILFSPDDGTSSFQVGEDDIFGLAKDWRKQRNKELSGELEARRATRILFTTPKDAIERALKSKYRKDVFD